MEDGIKRELTKIRKQFAQWGAFEDLKEAWETSLTRSQADTLIGELNKKYGKEVFYRVKWHPKDAGEPSRQGFSSFQVSHDCLLGEFFHQYSHIISPPIWIYTKQSRHHQMYFRTYFDMLYWFKNASGLYEGFKSTSEDSRKKQEERQRTREDFHKRQEEKTREEREDQRRKNAEFWRNFFNNFEAKVNGGGRPYQTPPSHFGRQGETPFSILGISNECEAPAAFKKLALQHHPDRFTDPDEKKKNEELFKKIAFAYDEIKRGTYRNWY